MVITTEQLNKFKKIYKQEFGLDLNDKEALDRALKVVILIKSVVKMKLTEPLRKSQTKLDAR